MAIQSVKVGCYKIPTDAPEADGTIEWTSTTLVTVQVAAHGKTGFGYTYSHRATAVLIDDLLSKLVVGQDEMNVTRIWQLMTREIRNLGRPGIVASAIAAVDTALWDLKAKILELPLVKLWGSVRDSIPVYGSGGFTSYDLPRLQKQLSSWAEDGIGMVKMKIGARPGDDLHRVRLAKEAIGDGTTLFVDANGAYTRKQALKFAEEFAKFGVAWFEEPVSSDDLDGLHFLRNHAPAGMAITAGEYGYDEFYFQNMLKAQAVDVLQADATRCMGLTGFLNAASLCDTYGLPLSAHTAPSIHVHACCAAVRAIHLEYFHDHARIEHLLFDGALAPKNGELRPNLSRPGLGVEFKYKDAQTYAV
jgi:L-alanine-DL-glutamate epimerase-like enolase superfamily enzyme